MTTPDLTPTPADTRQQAAEADELPSQWDVQPDVQRLREQGDWCCHLGCGEGACESCPCCCAGWCLNGGTDLPEDVEHLRLWLELAREHGSALVPVGERLLAAALVSSSPALPEPPAPGREPDWRSPGEIGWLGDGYEVTVDPTPGVTPRLRWQGRVASASWLRGLRDAITAALAAADVAEEQQP